MYNQDAKLSLDASDGAGDIVPPLLPVLDNRGKAEAVIVTRTGGASVRRVVNTPIRRTVALDLDVHSDTQLPALAGWAAAHTTWPGMRYPAVSPALAIVPALVADWVKLIPGDRIDLTGLPPQHPAGTVELMLLGTVEEIDANTSRGRAVCAPYGPYRAGVWQEVGATPDPDAPARYSPEDSQTGRPFDACSDTELLVVDGTGIDTWTADADAYPLDVAVSGVRLRAAAAGPAVADTFTRTVADGWGSPDVGPAWTLSGTAADFDVAAGVGTIAESSSLEGRWAVLDVEVGDFDLLVALSFSASEPGDGGLVARAGADPSQDSYEAALDPTFDLLWIGRTVGGSFTTLAWVVFTVD